MIAQPEGGQHYHGDTVKAQWQKAIEEMTSVIKTKHYSSKTLKSYSHWIWKFRDFRRRRKARWISKIGIQAED
jgi:hypothetical protein